MQDPDDILAFLAVARSGSISGAARKLGQDPATVGRKISRLEEGLKSTLFAKSPRGYAITEAGKRLRDHAETLEQLVLEIEDSFGEDKARLEGPLRIGAPDGCATFLLPQVCARLAQSHPGLVLEVVASSREFDLLNREVDLAISVSPPSAKAVATTPLADYQLHFAALKSVIDSATSPYDLPLISYIPELLVDPGLDLPQSFRNREPSLRSNSVLVQWAWLRDGAGIGLVHDFALSQAPELVRVHETFAIDRCYFLNMRRDDTRFKRTQALADLLAEEIRTQIALSRGLPELASA